MKQIFTLSFITIAVIVLLSFNNKAHAQSCAIVSTFNAATTHTFSTSSEGFTGDFTWTAAQSGSVQSSSLESGNLKVITSPTYFLPNNASSIYWGMEWAGSAQIESYSVVALYNNGASKIGICSGGSINNNHKNFAATAPSEILGTSFQFEITIVLSGNNPAFTKSLLEFRTTALESNIPLPVRLTNFTGSLVNKKAELKWLVDENETGSHFDVEKSNDGRNFTSNAMIMNSTKVGTETYSYTDQAELNGAVYYRLKITNRNGSTSYSNIIVLKSGTTSFNTLTLMQNPVSNTLNFTYNTPKTGTYTVTLYNTAGLKLFASKINCQPGVNSVSLPIDAKMAKGVYIMEVSGNTERAVKQILKN